MSTNEPVLTRLQAKEPGPSKTKGRTAYQNDHLGHQMEKGKQANLDNYPEREDEVSNVYVTDLLNRRCDLINTGQLMYK